MEDTKDLELVVEEIVTLINAKVDIPYVPESVEQVIIRAIVLTAFHLLSKKVS